MHPLSQAGECCCRWAATSLATHPPPLIPDPFLKAKVSFTIRGCSLSEKVCDDRKVMHWSVGGWVQGVGGGAIHLHILPVVWTVQRRPLLDTRAMSLWN